MDGCSLRHLIADGAVREPGALRFLAAWYRDYAEFAPIIPPSGTLA